MSRFLLTRQAQADINNIVDYIWQDSPQSALEFNNEVERICNLLADMPDLGYQISFITSYDCFMFPVGRFDSYLIIYLQEENTPVIIRVLHGRQDIEKLLKDD